VEKPEGKHKKPLSPVLEIHPKPFFLYIQILEI
jgi:hypothetical protein